MQWHCVRSGDIDPRCVSYRCVFWVICCVTAVYPHVYLHMRAAHCKTVTTVLGQVIFSVSLTVCISEIQGREAMSPWKSLRVGLQPC